MKILTKPILKELLKNGAERPEDPKPVLKLFCPWGAGTWLFTELDENEDTLYGLCDLGFGTPELGSASLAEMTAVTGPMGLKIERDLHFKANKTLAEYAAEARANDGIVA